MYAPREQPHMPPGSNHAPPGATSALPPWGATTHAPREHTITCPPGSNHAHPPMSNHACPTVDQRVTDTCKNITFANARLLGGNY